MRSPQRSVLPVVALLGAASLLLGSADSHSVPENDVSQLRPDVLMRSESGDRQPHPGSARFQGSSVTIGVVLALLANALSAVGTVLQRRAFMNYAAAGGQLKVGRSVYLQPLWLAGFLIYISSAPLDIWAYALAPGIVCAVIGATRIALVALLGSCYVDETLGLQGVGGTVLCLVGTVVTILARPETPSEFFVAPVDMFTPRLLWFLALTVPMMLPLAWADYSGAMAGYALFIRRLILPFLCAMIYVVEKVFNSMGGRIDMTWETITFNLLKRWSWLPAIIIFCGLADLYYNVRGVQLQCVSEFVPLSFAMNVLLQQIVAVAVLQERWRNNTTAVCAALGAVVAVAGALLVNPRQKSQRPGFAAPSAG